MQGALRSIQDHLDAALAFARSQLDVLMAPAQQAQLAIIAACILAAWILGRATRERMRAWMRTLEGAAKWRLRLLLIVNRRLTLIFFVALVGLATATVSTLVETPSHTLLLSLAGTISAAWLAVVFASRLVRNPLLRSVVRWGLLIWVTLYFLGLTGQTAALLDRIAIVMGDFRLSLLSLILAAILLTVLFMLARFVSTASAARIRRNDQISPSMQVLVIKVLQIALYAAALFLALRIVGVDLTGLAVLSGAIGVGLGFGLQKVVSNLVSGVIILLDKSIKPGDVITIGDTFGWINALGARYVSITTRDGREYLIPNEDMITGQVVNWSHSNDFVRLDIFFGTAYRDDPHTVRRVAIEAAASVDRVVRNRPPVCHIVGFGDSSVDYVLRFWITDPTGGLTNIRGNVYLALWDAFRANGITIPFPQREVKVLEGSTLATRATD